MASPGVMDFLCTSTFLKQSEFIGFFIIIYTLNGSFYPFLEMNKWGV